MVNYVCVCLALLFYLLFTGLHDGSVDTFTFTESDWGTASLLVGIVGPMATNVGTDTAAHLSEETRTSTELVPRAMMTMAAINYISGMVMLVIRPIDWSLYDIGGQPWVAVPLRNSGSRLKAAVFVIMMASVVSTAPLYPLKHR